DVQRSYVDSLLTDEESGRQLVSDAVRAEILKRFEYHTERPILPRAELDSLLENIPELDPDTDRGRQLRAGYYLKHEMLYRGIYGVSRDIQPEIVHEIALAEFRR